MPKRIRKKCSSHQIFWHVKGQSFEGTLKFLNESAASLGIRQQIPQDLTVSVSPLLSKIFASKLSHRNGCEFGVRV
ncbi:MAG: hypothetical protein AUG08_01175 [Acidobacteria bacterium 13_1_20CM_2_55_15]|nr:MAG: hypothetical protein AUH28_06495 [Acidobacteria bacterium 13_1_40CM_56_16]OLE90175.1 MAG: hypothetical protein AUG08_01175 [Acidobacteria bacterium 13_1_20CM_2_55_15]PYS16240.1 MAG: hypothetical protein DMG17_12750 [Acidobacteriota bacterium]